MYYSCDPLYFVPIHSRLKSQTDRRTHNILLQDFIVPSFADCYIRSFFRGSLAGQVLGIVLTKGISQHLHNNEHGNCMTTTSQIIREETIVECQESIVRHHFGHGLDGAGIWKLACGGILLLTSHAILGRFQRHGR
jgi:hypothetical protein